MTDNHTCVAIKNDGHKCEKKCVVGKIRCNTHLNTYNRNGPNRTAVNELRYLHKKELHDLNKIWNARIVLEEDGRQERDLTTDYQHAYQLKRIEQRHLIEILERQQRDEVIRTGIDPDREANNRRQEEKRLRQLENQRRNEEMNNHLNRLRLEQEANRGELARFASDNQNVHTTRTVNITKQIIKQLLTIPIPDGYKWNNEECSKTIGDIIMTCKLTPKAAWQMSAKYCQDESIYDLEKGIYGKVLDSVWQYIIRSPDKEDLCKCLKQEMEDNIGMCAQGNLSRLCNILAGYIEDIGSQESVADILGRLFPTLMNIEDISERLTEAFKILKDNNVPISQWLSWTTPLVMDQDVQYTIRINRNSNDEITGFIAVIA